MATPRGYRWNDALKRYIAPNGRIVSQAQVRAALDEALRAADAEAQALAAQLRAGAISLVEWEAAMRVLVKDVQLYGVASAAGGWAQLTPREFGRIGSLTRMQYDRLYNFARQIASGEQRLDGSMIVRASLYAKSGRNAFYRQLDVEMTEIEMDQERNILHPADHCGDCVAMASLGWVPRGTLIRVGERQCLGNCRCTIEYRSSGTGARALPRAPRRAAARR